MAKAGGGGGGTMISPTLRSSLTPPTLFPSAFPVPPSLPSILLALPPLPSPSLLLLRNLSKTHTVSPTMVTPPLSPPTTATMKVGWKEVVEDVWSIVGEGLTAAVVGGKWGERGGEEWGEC